MMIKFAKTLDIGTEDYCDEYWAREWLSDLIQINKRMSASVGWEISNKCVEVGGLGLVSLIGHVT